MKTYNCQFSEKEMTALICALQTSIIKYLKPYGIDYKVQDKLVKNLRGMKESCYSYTK